MKNKAQLRRMVLAAVLAALIIAMTFVPYTGYISYGVWSLEITTLHIVVIIGAISLGWKYGLFLGGVWGGMCILRAATNPLWYDFLNPMISLLPRMFVGLVAALLFAGLVKLKVNPIVSAVITAVLSTVIHTVTVLTMYHVFGGTVTESVYVLFGSIIKTIGSINGAVETIGAAILVPSIYKAISKLRVN